MSGHPATSDSDAAPCKTVIFLGEGEDAPEGDRRQILRKAQDRGRPEPIRRNTHLVVIQDH